jgi:hypothetical protein
VAGQEKSRRGRDPEAKALKTIHQAPDETIAQPDAHPDYDIRRTILVCQQMGDAPRRKDGQDEPHPELTR